MSINFQDCSLREVRLVLRNIYFTDNKIRQGWLSDFSRDVEELTISSSSLEELEDSAFSGKPFLNLQKLVIADSRIRYLRKESLKDLKINTFEFRCLSVTNIFVEFNALEHIADYLTILQFSQCIDDSEAIKNVTGTKVSMFNQLIEIDLSYNKMTNIPGETFVDAPRLISLYLFGNNLRSIDRNAFSGIGRTIQLLHLKDNNLKTLPDGIFEAFTASGEINIDDNPWECNCDLVWLKKFYTENIQRFFRDGNVSFTCTKGDYLEVEFCPNSSISETEAPTTPITAISTTTTTTTPESQESFVYLNCTNVTNYQDVLRDGLNRIYSHTVQVRNGTITYKFYQIQSTPHFEIHLLNNVGKDYLVWINSKNFSDYGCVTDIQQTVILDNLNYGMTYTICLLKQFEDTVTPFDCTSLTVPLEWEYCAWIINKYMPAVIGGVVSSTLVIIIITSVIIFYTIRQNPKLIKGNKRVVIVRNKSADALVMPNYEKQRYIPPSIYTNSEGYLTPRSKMYERINEKRFRPLNTITEKFYQDFQGTVSRSARSNYAGFLHRKSVGSEVYEPPPLPPNHPSERPSSSCPSTIYRL